MKTVKHTLQLTEEERALLYKALSFQMVDLEFYGSFKGKNYSAEKHAVDRLLRKLTGLK